LTLCDRMMGAFRKRRKATAPRTARMRAVAAAKACQAARMVSRKFAISSVRRSRSLASERTGVSTCAHAPLVAAAPR